MPMNPLCLKTKKVILFSLICLLSITGFGQNSKTNNYNFKKAGIRINNNSDFSETSQKNIISKKLINSNNLIINGNNILSEQLATENNKKKPKPLQNTKSTTIYSEDFEVFSGGEGLLGTSAVHGWRSSINPSNCGRNYWGVYSSGSNSIDNIGLKVTAADGSCNIYPGQYLINSTSDMYAYVTIDASGYENLNLNFDWICEGEIFSGIYYDYGTVMYHQGTSGSWTTINTGGNNGMGKYAGQTTRQTENLSLPSSLNDGTFQIAFRWINDNAYGTYDAFVIDNIVIEGDALPEPPTCTTPIMPIDGSGSHSPVDPLQWTSVANATSYDVFLGTSTNPPFVANVNTNTYSTTLAENTTYYWKIVPKNAHGEPTGCAIWEFTTSAGPATGDYRTRYLTGPYAWNEPDKWEVFNGGSWVVATSLPGANNNVLIRKNSQYVVLNNPMTATGTHATCKNLRVEGTLQFWNGLSASDDAYGDLDIYENLDISTTGTIETFMNVTNIEAVSAINMINGGAITNYGTLMLYDEYNNRSYTHAWITFFGSEKSDFNLAPGSNTRLFYLQIAKDNPTDTVIFNVNEDFLAVNNQYAGNNGFLKSYNLNTWDETPSGHFIIKGTYAKNNPVWFMGLSTYSLTFNTSNGISSNLTAELDNANFGIMAQNVSFNLAGKLIVNQGQCDIGATSGTSGGVDQSEYYLNILNGGSIEINGGSINTRAGIAGNGTHYFKMTGGAVNVGRNANASIRGLFDLQGNPQVTITGGIITLSDNRYVTNNLGYRVDDGNINITGGKLQIGSVSSPAGSNSFSVRGHTPSIELYTDNTSIFSNIIMWEDVNCYGYVNIPVGCALSIYNQDNGDLPYNLSLTGDFNHLGNLYAEVEDSKITFMGNSTQNFTSTGLYSGDGISLLEINNSAGVNLIGNGTTVIKNLNQTLGTFNIGSSELTLIGNITRTSGFFGGTDQSVLNILGQGTLGNMFFDASLNRLKTLNLNRTTSGNIFLATDVNIEESINFDNGVLYTYENGLVANGSKTIYIEPNATLNNENSNSYIYGKVSTTKNLSSAIEPGNLGANFSNLSQNLGSTTIERVTGDEGVQIITGAASIACHWDINVSSQPTTPVNMIFKWLDVFDNGLSTNDMIVYTLHNPNPWQELGVPVNVSGNPRSISADANQFSKWTVAQKTNPTPVELLYFNADCNNNTITFNWATASEINNDYFIIQSSIDGENFNDIAKIQGAGNSNQLNEYSFNYEQRYNNEIYYRLKQVDFDGTSETFDIIYVKCNELNKPQINVYPNPFDGQNICINYSNDADKTLIKIIDTSGRIIDKFEITLTKGDNNIQMNKPLDAGLYIMNIQSQNHKFNQNIEIIVR